MPPPFLRGRHAAASADSCRPCIAAQAVPFAWPRLATGTSASKSAEDPTYGPAVAAMYGGNKLWQAQYADVNGQARYGSVDDDVTALAGRPPFWPATNGLPPTTAWPDFGDKPVLLLPAAETLEGGGALPCTAAQLAADAACQAQVLGAPKLWYPKLYLSYADTLGINTTLQPMEGDHSFPYKHANETAALLVAHFAGV